MLGPDDFWIDLEFRVCRELAGLRDDAWRGWWCDGFIPDTFEIDAGGGGVARVRGTVWVARDEHQWPWEFTLVVGPGVAGPEAIDWARLMPGEDVTGWLSMDLRGRRMRVEPGAGYADPAPGPLGEEGA